MLKSAVLCGMIFLYWNKGVIALHYAAIKNCDIANGPGVRVSLFVSGCTRRCPDCFNSVAWPFDYGDPLTPEVLDRIISMLSPSYVQGLTILGGEPMEPQNQPGVLEVVKAVRERLPEKTIWCFTGYVLEEHLLKGKCHIPDVTLPLLQNLDVLVDGPFMKEQKDLSLSFRGSRNQRLLDMKKTLETGSPVFWQDWQERK